MGVRQTLEQLPRTAVAVMPSISIRRRHWHNRNLQYGLKAPGPSTYFDDPRSDQFEKEYESAVVPIVLSEVKRSNERYAEHRSRVKKSRRLFLDFGCGVGNIAAGEGQLYARLIEEFGWSTCGFDFDPCAVGITRERLALQLPGHDTSSMVVCKPSHKLQGRPRPLKFDVGLASRYLHHEDEAAREELIAGWRPHFAMPWSSFIVIGPFQEDNPDREPVRNEFAHMPSIAEIRSHFEPLELVWSQPVPYYPDEEKYRCCIFANARYY